MLLHEIALNSMLSNKIPLTISLVRGPTLLSPIMNFVMPLGSSRNRKLLPQAYSCSFKSPFICFPLELLDPRDCLHKHGQHKREQVLNSSRSTVGLPVCQLYPRACLYKYRQHKREQLLNSNSSKQSSKKIYNVRYNLKSMQIELLAMARNITGNAEQFGWIFNGTTPHRTSASWRDHLAV